MKMSEVFHPHDPVEYGFAVHYRVQTDGTLCVVTVVEHSTKPLSDFCAELYDDYNKRYHVIRMTANHPWVGKPVTYERNKSKSNTVVAVMETKVDNESYEVGIVFSLGSGHYL